MRIAIQNANIVLPHKNTILANSSIVIENGLIFKIIKGVRFSYDSKANLIVDAENGYLIPGIINHHAHGVSLGPLFSAGNPAPPLELIISNLNKHLLQGTTTILNEDGFATMEETEIMNKLHPIKIKTATSHTPLNIQAAEITDGSGLNSFHKTLTVESMLGRGAVALGEIGGGDTLGGGGVCYNLLPKTIEEKTGKRITASEAEKLMWAVLGRYINTSLTDRKKVETVLGKIGLKGLISIDEAIDIILQVVYSPVETGRNGIREAADLALQYNMPVVIHNAAGCKEVVFEVAEKLGSRLIAAHSSHPSFTKDEIVENIKKLKSFGAIIDVCCGDYFGAKNLCPPEYLDIAINLIEEGLADLISTDFMAGNWDPLLLIIKKAVEEEKISLPSALAMLSCNVAKAIPKLAPNTGFIEEGKAADLVVLNSNNLAEVQHVFIDGIQVVINGEMKAPKANWLWY
jgi:imidazolonepropionase-like amidohydrolase